MERVSTLGRARVMTVSFSGMDGAGKSTQITALTGRLEAAGIRVRQVAFWDEVARFRSVRETASHTLFHGDKGVGRPDAPIERRDKNVQRWYMTWVRLFLYCADALSLRRVARQAMQSGAEVVIFDRYAYDELVNLPLGRWMARRYARGILKLVPRPNLSLVLDADPVAARARKPEYPLEFLYRCRESYAALDRLIGGMTMLAPMRPSEVEREIWRHALGKLAACGISRKGLECDDPARLDGGVARAAAP